MINVPRVFFFLFRQRHDMKCTHTPARRDAPRASPSARRSLQIPQRQPTSRQARGERNFELCGHSSWRIGSGSASKGPLLEGGEHTYICIQASSKYLH